jgi:hypothetical protein
VSTEIESCGRCGRPLLYIEGIGKRAFVADYGEHGEWTEYVTLGYRAQLPSGYVPSPPVQITCRIAITSRGTDGWVRADGSASDAATSARLERNLTRDPGL